MGLHPSFNHAFRTFLNDAGILAFPSGKAVSPFSSKSEKGAKTGGCTNVGAMTNGICFLSRRVGRHVVLLIHLKPS